MEELKLIMQTLMGLGETAKEGFIWWLVITKLVPALLWGCFGGSAIGLGVYIAKQISAAYQADRNMIREKEGSIAAIKVIRSILGLYRYPSRMQDDDYYTTSDFSDTVEAIRAVKKSASTKKDTD